MIKLSIDPIEIAQHVGFSGQCLKSVTHKVCDPSGKFTSVSENVRITTKGFVAGKLDNCVPEECYFFVHVNNVPYEFFLEKCKEFIQEYISKEKGEAA